MKCPVRSDLVVEVDQRLVLRDDERRRAGRRYRGRRRPGRGPRCSAWNGGPARSETSVSRPPGPPSRSCSGIVQGNRGRPSRTCPLARDQVEPAVVVGVEEGDAEAEQRPARRRQADRRRVVGEESAAQVAVEASSTRRSSWSRPGRAGRRRRGRRRRCPSPPCSPRPRRTRPPRSLADLLEPEAAQVAEQVVGRHVVGDVQVDPVVVVEVGGDDPEPPPVGVDEPGLARSRPRTGRRRCGRRGRAATGNRSGCRSWSFGDSGCSHRLGFVGS